MAADFAWELPCPMLRGGGKAVDAACASAFACVKLGRRRRGLATAVAWASSCPVLMGGVQGRSRRCGPGIFLPRAEWGRQGHGHCICLVIFLRRAGGGGATAWPALLPHRLPAPRWWGGGKGVAAAFASALACAGLEGGGEDVAAAVALASSCPVPGGGGQGRVRRLCLGVCLRWAGRGGQGRGRRSCLGVFLPRA